MYSRKRTRARARKFIKNALIAGSMGLAVIASWAVTDMTQPQLGVQIVR